MHLKLASASQNHDTLRLFAAPYCSFLVRATLQADYRHRAHPALLYNYTKHTDTRGRRRAHQIPYRVLELCRTSLDKLGRYLSNGLSARVCQALFS